MTSSSAKHQPEQRSNQLELNPPVCCGCAETKHSVDVIGLFYSTGVIKVNTSDGLFHLSVPVSRHVQYEESWSDTSKWIINVISYTCDFPLWHEKDLFIVNTQKNININNTNCILTRHLYLPALGGWTGGGLVTAAVISVFCPVKTHTLTHIVKNRASLLIWRVFFLNGAIYLSLNCIFRLI